MDVTNLVNTSYLHINNKVTLLIVAVDDKRVHGEFYIDGERWATIAYHRRDIDSILDGVEWIPIP